MARKSYRNNYEFVDTAYVNNSTYIDFLNRFKQVALSQFEWVNLPSSMNGDYLERCLYYFGQASLLKTEQYGFINTKCCANGQINIYGYPSSLNCFSYGFQESRKLYTGLIPNQTEYEACVLVKNNWEKIPTAGTMELFALRLYEAERTSDVNIKAQKTPVMIVGDESLKLTMKNLYLKYDGNEPIIYADKKQLGTNSLNAIRTDAPFIADKIQSYKERIWNEALTFLGIDNISSEKKERLVSAEVSSNNEIVNLNLQARLACRKRACQEFNEYFGLTGENAIDVKVRADLHNIVKTMDSVCELPEDKKEELAKEVI